MPNVKISAATDAGTLLSSDMLPLARSGDTNAYHATMSEVATYTGASISSGTYGNTGRSLIHNPLFTVAQRGAGSFTTAGFCLDRWSLDLNLDTASVQQAVLADAARTAIGDEAAEYGLQATFTGNSGAAAYSAVAQSIEDVRRLSGKTVTVSFYAVASAAIKLGIGMEQNFGTGGSPSAIVTLPGQSVSLTTAWGPRYSVTFNIPSTNGKTIGTNSDHATQLYLAYSSGTTNNAAFGNIGVQSGTVIVWGVQLEVGSVATPLAKRDPGDEIRLCTRFYQVVSANIRVQATGSANYGCTVNWQTMRVPPPNPPTVVAGGTNVNVSSVALVSVNASGGLFQIVSVGSGDAYSLSTQFGVSAEL